jgi:uncharacterized membrane protein
MEYLYTLSVLVLLDIIYIYNTKKPLFKMIKEIQNGDPNIRKVPLVLTYLVMAAGLYYFIIKVRKKVEDAFILGTLVYGIYNLTNYTIFNKWDTTVMMMDTFWGGVLFGLTSHIIYRLIGIKKI